jgi:hypothetical protein
MPSATSRVDATDRRFSRELREDLVDERVGSLTERVTDDIALAVLTGAREERTRGVRGTRRLSFRRSTRGARGSHGASRVRDGPMRRRSGWYLARERGLAARLPMNRSTVCGSRATAGFSSRPCSTHQTACRARTTANRLAIPWPCGASRRSASTTNAWIGPSHRSGAQSGASPTVVAAITGSTSEDKPRISLLAHHPRRRSRPKVDIGS